MCRVFVSALALSIVTASVSAQPPQKPENLQYFPKDIAQPDLIQRMREFSFALGVRCQYCHSGGNGVSFEGVKFAADDKPAKLKARAMLRMVDEINASLLAKVPSRAEPRVEVTCATCHHGLALPKSLQTTLLEVIDQEGPAAAAAKYRQLRTDYALTGAYNFGEWEMNELARRLATGGKTDAAIAMLDLNREFYPKSAEIEFSIGELHLRRGERDLALQRYRAALDKAPAHQGAKRRIEELEKK